MKKLNSNKQQGFTHILLLIVLVAVIAGVGYFAYQRVQDNNVAKTSQNITIAKKPKIVQGVTFSQTVDSKGKAIAPTTVLGATNTKINVVSTLDNAIKGTRIAYTRYLNNDFVDNGSLAVNKAGAKYVNFTFNAKKGDKFKPGTYKIKIYANGRYQTTGTYVIK